MTCFCLCHNGFAVEKGKAPSHDEKDCDCMKVEDSTLRAQVQITEQIEEQLLQKAKMEEALRAISDGHGCELHQCGIIAAKALEPTVLCTGCRKLTTSTPCVNCGKS